MKSMIITASLRSSESACLNKYVLFRCVPDSQRSFGLGIQWIVVRTLGKWVLLPSLLNAFHLWIMTTGFILFSKMF